MLRPVFFMPPALSAEFLALDFQLMNLPLPAFYIRMLLGVARLHLSQLDAQRRELCIQFPAAQIDVGFSRG